MTIKVPVPITSSFIEAHPEYLFIYSGAVKVDTFFGQAAIANSYDNCIDVPVRWSLCTSNGYFNDNSFDDIKFEIDQRITYVMRMSNGRQIIPFPKIGWGASRMKEFAPKAFHYLHGRIAWIMHPDIEYIRIPAPPITSSGQTIDTKIV